MSALPPFVGRLKTLSGYSGLAGLALAFGFLREVVVASEFGLSAELDVFVAVMGFHLFLGVQIGNALETAFISKVGRVGGAEHVARQFALSLRGLLIVNTLIILFLLALSQPLVTFIFPGFSQEQTALAVRITQLLLIAIVASNIAGLARGGLHVMRRFTPSFLSGVVVSMSSIACVLLLADHIGIFALVAGVTFGHIAVLVFLVFSLVRHKATSVSVSGIDGQGMFFVWGAAAIILVSELLFQAYAMTERSYASTLPVGTISSFFYATALVAVPVTLFVAPLTTTIFPRLAEVFTTEPAEGVRILKTYGLGLFLFALFAGIALSVFAGDVVRLAFVRGNFTLEDATRTGGILSIIAFVLPFISISRLIRYSLYSLSDYATAVYANLATWLSLLGIAAYMVPKYGIKGLAVATIIAVACGVLVMAFTLIYRLRRIQAD